ncbi:SDR family oxidoreductase [Amphiplicatus metriothermophilus]|uniref:Short-chain dehydrogenase n=1 Tax=Amphiplicatus metriothermophilus TaxID=1519374 RepID=A0A239PXI2_9PROT|nr:SDR family oxidoreductase [Amphiplicatus metriothermophilus]MBB5519895.1 hypothetical protein [Amphiplicatus metriothermophilus]SNT74798.1 hypothetical protein SAMN06297382_2384 [Amphiplicatus metriothermophilus]
MSGQDAPAAVVTGASSGIGRAIAATLTDAGWRVFAGVRKEADGAALRDALGPRLTPLIFDVTDAPAIARAADTVSGALGGRALKGLVNNAGIAVGGPLAHLPMEDLHRQLDVNLYGALRVTQAFLPMLGADRRFQGPPGRIVNMSSVAGKNAMPLNGPYSISKHALEAMSETLRREILPLHGIDVVIIGPGAVRTPIWEKPKLDDYRKYQHTAYWPYLKRMAALMKEVGDDGLEPEAVGRLVLRALTAKRPKTRYAILKNRFMLWTLPRLLPRRMVDAMIAKRFGMAPAGRR